MEEQQREEQLRQQVALLSQELEHAQVILDGIFMCLLGPFVSIRTCRVKARMCCPHIAHSVELVDEQALQDTRWNNTTLLDCGLLHVQSCWIA
jgi:hypothetical protein